MTQPSVTPPVDDVPDYDVVVVGYGPVGQLLALLLGRAGHRVAVLERWPSFYPMPRAVHFDHEVARIFQGVGLRPDTSPSIEPYDDLYVWRNAERNTLLNVDWSGVGPTGWHTSNFFTQPLLEPELDALVQAQPTVDVQRGWQALTVQDDPAAHHVTIVAGQTEGADATGQRRTLTARYVVGADGANSMVREAIGSPVHDLGFVFDWLIVDLVLHEQRSFDPPAWQLADPARPTTIVPAGPGRRRWEFMRLPHETIAELNTPQRAWELLAPWDVTPDNSTLERHTVYTFQARWADTWRRGRLLIAGDAAHLMPPFAGQGMCAGLRDAMNVGWKLDRVLRGVSPDSLLDTYTPERTPHVRHFIDMSMALGAVICISDPAAAAARDEQMMAALQDPSLAPPTPAPPRLGPGLLDADSPAAGLMSVQAPVSGAHSSGLLDDVLGVGGCLLLADDTLLVRLADHHSQLAEAELPVVALAELAGKDAIVDTTGAYAQWLKDLGAVAVLIRPDFAVYGTAQRAEDVTDLVLRYHHALTAISPPTPATAHHGTDTISEAVAAATVPAATQGVLS